MTTTTTTIAASITVPSSVYRRNHRAGAVVADAASVRLRLRGCVKRVFSGASLTPRCATRRDAVSTRAVKSGDDTTSSSSEVVLGVYVNASAEDLRAAPLDARTGEFAKAGASTKLEARTARGIAEAVAKLVDTLEWRGRVGVSLPGLLTRVEGEVGNAREGTLARDEVEAACRTATGCDVSVAGGAEACGAAELKFGAGVSLSQDAREGLVMFCMVGGRFSTALFEHGEVVKNFEGEKIVDSWSDDDEEGGTRAAKIPLNNDDTEGWNAYAARVNAYLLKLSAKYKPDAIILGGKAGENADKILDKLTCETQVVAGTLGFVAGVKGAAVLASQQLDARETLSQVREAIGLETGVSPQYVTDEQLRSVFDKFDANGSGVLELSELAAATAALNVRVDDVKRLMDLLDYDNNGVVSFQEWRRWWESEIKNETVTTIVSQDEWEKLQKNERDRLICLEVGFTFCRPCKAFARKYEKIAEEFPSIKFVFMNGNENGSTTVLARDVLGIKTTPSFFLFRSGERLHFHSGAKEERLRNAINRHIRDEEWPTALLGDRPPVISEEEEARLRENA
jgi:thiol-disulfide isomerase/thioredoxin